MLLLFFFFFCNYFKILYLIKFYINFLPSFTREQDKFASQNVVKKVNTNSNKVPTFFKTPISTFVSFFTKNLFTKFMKTFIKITEIQIRSWKHFFKAKSVEIYLGKTYIDYYHFYQQCKYHFKISSPIGINNISFAFLFFCGTISLS